MKREGNVIVFESEEKAKSALAELEFVKGVREEGEKTRQAARAFEWCNPPGE